MFQKRKERRKDMKKFFIGIIGFLLFNVTVQAESYDFSLIPYNVTNACEFTEEIGGQECFDKMLDGEIEEYKIMDGKIARNDIIMIVLHLNPSLDSKISDARIVIDTDPNVLLSEIDDLGVDYGVNNRTDQTIGGILPLNGKKTSWTIGEPII